MLTYSIFYYFFWIATLILFARNDGKVDPCGQCSPHGGVVAGSYVAIYI
ncbi:hypothetical protein RBEAN4_0278 [Rickettsia bellii str. RML An4]|uniref:Uncharacterized protein n=1 Tax=Rickettsia bellii str. RML An4 TaxID=1359193 RepID=A0A0F3QAV2_RICBE|nr:hypothetical protein RBEAN4_0278 [Rickettsia bellii str. RML An4]